MNKKILAAVVLMSILFIACKKETEELKLPIISDYSPLVVGKYIVYNLDSVVFYTNFGASAVTKSYQVKHEVDAEITDNLGRPAFRIIRYIRNNAAGSWVPDNTFTAINTGNSLEFIEDNLRFLKMKEPIRNGFSWKGNAYIDTYSGNSDYTYMDSWDYTYDSLNAPLTLGSLTIDSTLKVNQRDEIIGNPTDPASYSQVNTASENYAKGIGLVYRWFYHEEYQPPTSSTGYMTGYGVRLTMIDHN